MKIGKYIIIFIFISSVLLPMVSSSINVTFPPSTNWELGFNETSAGSSSSINNNRMYFNIDGGLNDADELYYVTVNTVNLSNATYIAVEWKGTFGAVPGAMSVGISISKNDNSFIKNVTKTSTFSTTTSYCNVNGYEGEYYLKAGGYTTSNIFIDSIEGYIYNITVYNETSSYPMNVTSISTTSATINGYLINDTNLSTTCGFWVGNVSTNFTWFEQNVTCTGTYSSGQNFSYGLTGLTSGEYYYVRSWSYTSYGFNISENESYFLTQPQPPSSFRVSSITAQTLTLSWNNATLPAGTNSSVIIRYSTSSPPTNYSSGTYGDNVSTTNSTTISGLEEETTYYFSAFTYINASGSPLFETYSSYTSTTNATQGGVYNIQIRCENESNGNNYRLSLNNPWANHTLVIHYADETDYVRFLGGGITYTSDVDGFFTNIINGNFTITVNKTIRDMEFHWNDSINRPYRCNRIIVPGTTQRNITFYVRNDLTVYGESSAYLNQSLVRYTYSFLDENGVFQYPNNPFVKIYIYNSSGTRLTIHSEYFDSAKKVYPWLEFGKQYFIGVDCDVLEIDRIGTAPTGELTSEDVRIPYIGNMTYSFFDLINLDVGWYADGFYVDYFDTTFSTVLVTFNVYYYENDTFVYSENSTLDDVNFTYTTGEGCNTSIAYKWQLIATLEDDTFEGTYYAGGQQSGIPIFPGLEPITDVNTLDDLMEIIFGQTPLYNVDNPSEGVRWSYLLLFSISFIVLVTFGKLNAFLGSLSVGIVLLLGGTLVTGLGFVIVIAIFLMALGIIGLLGGVEKG